MAWTERTIHEVADPAPAGGKDEEDRINNILKNMPPFIKLSSRRARKTLAKYEEVKQRHIENLRNNPVFKFVMMVAGFTNEHMQKYWKGSDISPFQEGYGPKDVKIDREEIELLVVRARERAFADLHQFCKPIPAIPMFRKGNRREQTFTNRRGFRTRSDGDLTMGGLDLAISQSSPRRRRPLKPSKLNMSPGDNSIASQKTESPQPQGNMRNPHKTDDYERPDGNFA